MCKVIAVLNTNKDNTEHINRLIAANMTELANQRHGYSIYDGTEPAFYPSTESYTLKALQHNLTYKGSPLWIAHFRISTGGEQGTNGLHLQRIHNRYVFAHNGTVREFSKVKHYNDSYYYFKRLAASEYITANRVKKLNEKYGFMGKGFLFDEQTKSFYVFCNSAMHMYVLNDCIVYATFELKLEYEPYRPYQVLGRTFWKKDAPFKIPIILSEKIDDLFIKYTDNVFVEEKDIRRFSSQTPNGTATTLVPTTPVITQTPQPVTTILKREGNGLPFPATPLHDYCGYDN